MKEIAVIINLKEENDLTYKSFLSGPFTYLDILIKNTYKTVKFIENHREKKNVTAAMYLTFEEGLDFDGYYKKKLSKLALPVIGVVGSSKDIWLKAKPEYLCFVGDKYPLTPSALINKCINCAINHRLDYISNFGTFKPDISVEVLSDEMMLWADKHNIKYPELYDMDPAWARLAVVSSIIDESNETIDLPNVASQYRKRIEKECKWKEKGFGVYEF